MALIKYDKNIWEKIALKDDDYIINYEMYNDDDSIVPVIRRRMEFSLTPYTHQPSGSILYPSYGEYKLNIEKSGTEYKVLSCERVFL